MKFIIDIFTYLSEFIAKPFVVDWLGNGRTVEFFLSGVAGACGVGMLLNLPATIAFSLPPYGSYSNIVGWQLGLLLIIKSLLSGGGLFLNILALKYSRIMRFSGAFLGSVLWIFMAIWTHHTYSNKDATDLIVLVFTISASLISVRIMIMALSNIPAPGK